MIWIYMLGAFLFGFIVGGYILFQKGKKWQKKIDQRKLHSVYQDLGKLVGSKMVR